MFYFLKFSRQLTDDEILQFEDDEKSLKKNPPGLDQIKERIDHYEDIHDHADQTDQIKIFEKWFKADVRPFKYVSFNLIVSLMNKN